MSERDERRRQGLQELFAEVKENSRRLDGCADHLFVEAERRGHMATRYRCFRCGGEVDPHARNWYEAGRRHGPHGRTGEEDTA